MINSSHSDETITAAKQWLKSLPIHDMETVECGSDTLNDSHILEIEKAIIKLKVCIIIIIIIRNAILCM